MSLPNRDIRLTTCAPKPWRRSMDLYTHVHLADTAGAVEALPGIAQAQPDAKRLMSGTDM